MDISIGGKYGNRHSYFGYLFCFIYFSETLYIFLKIAGSRTLLRMTSFDFILLLIISEATQQAMLPDDLSVTSAIISIVTLFSIDIIFSLIKSYIPFLDKFLDAHR